jgi:thiamine-phosphate pyrophosphorylase
MSRLDRFYLIVDDLQWVRRLVPQGVKLLQLRIKNADDGELRRQVHGAMKLCEQYDCQLVLNDYWKLAIELGCDFVHLGQEDLAEADVRAIRNAGIRLGVSTHDDGELEVALRTEPAYVALGPVYPTILKKMPWAPQGLERVREWKRRVGDIPLVGIGGLTVERGPGVLDAGADIVSVVTDVSLNACPEARVRQWLEVTRP